MTLPEMITDFFQKVQSGIIDPLINGLYFLMPGFLVLALIVAVLTLIFAQRASAKIGAIAMVIVLAAVIPSIPELMNAFMSWFGGSGSVDVSSATDAAQQGLDAGMAETLGEMSGK